MLQMNRKREKENINNVVNVVNICPTSKLVKKKRETKLNQEKDK